MEGAPAERDEPVLRLLRYFRLWRSARKRLRYLCLLIFFRRFLMREPMGPWSDGEAPRFAGPAPLRNPGVGRSPLPWYARRHDRRHPSAESGRDRDRGQPRNRPGDRRSSRPGRGRRGARGPQGGAAAGRGRRHQRLRRPGPGGRLPHRARRRGGGPLRADGRRVRPSRRPGEQRRHQPLLRAHPWSHRRRLRQDLRGERQGLPVHSPGVRRPGQRRGHRQRRLVRRPPRGARSWAPTA